MNKENTLVNDNVLHTFEEVKELYYVYINNKESRELIERAYSFVEYHHRNQYRKSGEPYVHHLIEVCYILAELNCGPATLAAGLLHDVVEDTEVTLEEIKEKFGEDVCEIVDSLTKIQRMKLSHRTEEEFVAEDHRKIFLGMAKDVRVVVVKLADRLHNMRTLDSLSPIRQQVLSRETLEVFVPIAHRLGINTIKSELEDLSLKYLNPDAYNDIVDRLKVRIKNRSKSLDSLTKRIADILFDNKIPFEIKSREKSVYSIYRKIYEKGHNFDDIFDLLAIRIITKTELQCYEILGIIHATYKPIPGRFKDYIAMPKPNMYQSLHTCIISGDGNIFEVQIRTEEMDEVAESGIAAHWRYKEGSNYNAKAEQKEIEEKLHWIKDLVNLGEEDTDAKGYMESLSQDIFGANVYVFTPKGKVVDLPNGATPLDFAYKIHTGVGDSAVGAIVNGSLVPLNTTLKTGDVVEIRTSKNSSGPSERWLTIAKTNSARAHIKRYLARKEEELLREERIEKGRSQIADAFKQLDISEQEMMRMLDNDALLENFGVKELDDLFVNITQRNPIPGAITDYLGLKPAKDEIKLEKRKIDTSDMPVYVPGVGRIAITLGSCCTPIPGDDITGYITKGKGVTVHRTNCPNIVGQKQRLIEVLWKENLGIKTYPVDIKIEANDRTNLLVDVMNLFASRKVPVTALNAHFHQSTMTTTFTATIFISDAKALTDIFNALLNVHSVYDVTRVIH
ncbi:MAG: bifunctional (p)ppGpp synthetase/guanosine-3',5'-bis(diphosphate) 3'-pyrophosphohydrolase [Bacilli bacterium]|nr:bifunctional (p)ppGpp synthetase/guanosine-3',5'-bis(diphosphate) 3'-pyrophosphohydrolase [Bacilli bacterium]